MKLWAYVDIDGGTIKGESKDSNHPDWIGIVDFTYKIKQPASNVVNVESVLSNRVNIEEPFTIAKEIDKASPGLAIACCEGTVFKKIIVHVCQTSAGKSHQYMVYTLENAIVSSMKPFVPDPLKPDNDSQETTKPLELVTFAYGKMRWEYTPILHGGEQGSAETTGFDFARGERI